MRAEPDVTALAHVDIGVEVLGVLAPDEAVGPVRSDDEIGFGEARVVCDLGLKHQLDAQRCGARLQDVEQLLAGNAAEAVAAGGDLRALEEDVDVVPVVEAAQDLGVALRIGLPEVVQCRVGEHDAPAERVVGAVALEHGDLVPSVGLLHQDREIEPGRPATDADDLHARLYPIIRGRWLVRDDSRVDLLVLNVLAVKQFPRRFGPLSPGAPASGRADQRRVAPQSRLCRLCGASLGW